MTPRHGDTGSRFVVGGHQPAFLRTWDDGLIPGKVEAARSELARCRACPRDCGVDRLGGEHGQCRSGRWVVVSSAFPHHGEEACLRGRRGSGTIFFAGCNLRCVFCQNWDISASAAGDTVEPQELAAVMISLQGSGCHNINLVTPEHVAPQIVEAIALAIPMGLSIPIVYNTSAYDGAASLHLMEGLVDVYMPDFKFWEPATARRLARAADYPEVARAAVAEMHRQVGVLRTDAGGLAVRGVLVRHLVMPGLAAESAAILRWLAEEISPDTYVNVMGQYRPEHRVPGAERYADIDRRPTAEEVRAARRAAVDAGLWRLEHPC
jgi:putative pyruvate formate lyase activating enzyme